MSIHVILAFDGRNDRLRPGRWLAQPHPAWLSDMVLTAYGPTMEAAVQGVRETLRRRYPQIPWFATVPARRETGLPPALNSPSDPSQIVERWTERPMRTPSEVRCYRTADGRVWREERWPVYDPRVRLGRVTSERIEPMN